MNTMQGRRFEYTVHGFELRVVFESETRLHWTNLSKPESDAGRSAVEDVDRRDICEGIVLMAWTEGSGAHVVDILDLNTHRLHSNLVTPNGERSFAVAEVSETDP